jgi:aromatic ring-cleaving dioxygenase
MYNQREIIRKTSYDFADDMKSRNIGVGVQWPYSVRFKKQKVTKMSNWLMINFLSTAQNIYGGKISLYLKKFY